VTSDSRLVDRRRRVASAVMVLTGACRWLPSPAANRRPRRTGSRLCALESASVTVSGLSAVPPWATQFHVATPASSRERRWLRECRTTARPGRSANVAPDAA